MRRLFLAGLIFFFAGPVPGTVMHFPADNIVQSATARPLELPPQRVGALRFVRGWDLVSPNSHFGGFSGLARLGPGHFQLVGDIGYLTHLALDSDGHVTAMRIAALPSLDGRPARKSQADTEAMAADPVSGKIWVALEGRNQVWRLDAAAAHIESHRRLPGPPNWPSNRGPEAMVRLADGRTLIFSEDADGDRRGREALLYAGDPASPGPPPLRFFYDSEGKGLVSDAAPLPDGRVLLVHRKLGLHPLFTTILSLVDPVEIRRDGVLRSRTIAVVPPELAENYEGAAIAVEDGRTFLWLVSDDNFNRWQRSLLLQFEIANLPPRDVADSNRVADSKKAAR